jgi:RHS repeat-associated protein
VQHLASGQVSTYIWDGENRMVGAVLAGGVVDTFTYNADGQRVGKTDQGGPVNYVWDGQNVLIEANASNAIEAVHTLEPAYYGNQVSQRRSGVTSYYHFDAHGSTIDLTGAAGTATDSYLYRAFGDLVTSSGTTVNPYQYGGRKGYIYDSDLFNFQVRARRYDPDMGRWWSRDPIGFAGGDANLYRYVGNGPLVGSDPSGTEEISIEYNSWLMMDCRVVTARGQSRSPTISYRGLGRCGRTRRTRGKAAGFPAGLHGGGGATTAAATRTPPWC